MAEYSDLSKAIEGIVEAVLRESRRAEAVDPVECDALLTSILDADRKLRTATAYLRRVARPRSVSGYGESHDRMIESGDRLHIGMDDPAFDDEGESDNDAWSEFIASHPELLAAAKAQEPLALPDDEAIIAAVETSIALCLAWRRAKHFEIYRENKGATAREVAKVLLGATEFTGGPQPIRGDVIIIGRRLAHLARTGQIRLVSRPYERPFYAPIEGSRDDG